MLSRGYSYTQPASIKLVRSLPRMHLLNSLSASVDLSSTDSLPHNLGPNIAVSVYHVLQSYSWECKNKIDSNCT